MKIQLSDHFTFKKLFRFVYPTIIMMVFISIYGVVDGYFVSNYVGKDEFAALNLIMPFIMIIGGTGFMVGTGGCALVAKLLGQKEHKKANDVFSMVVIFTVILAIILCIGGNLSIKKVAYFFGATEKLIDNCVLYGRICICFCPFFMLQNVFQNFLATAEKPKLGLIVTICAGITNIILDFLFIGVFKFGLIGAALATGLGQLVGSIIPFLYFVLKKNHLLYFSFTRLKFKPLFNVCVNGSSELLSNISSSIVGIIYNMQLLKYYGEDGVSAYGVLMYVQFIFIAIYIGYAIGIAPIIGFNYGSRNVIELKNIFKKSILIMIVLGTILCLSAELGAKLLSRIFVGYDENLFNLTIFALRIASFVFLFAGVNIFSSCLFTALNNGGISALISFLRTLVFQTGSCLVLPIIFNREGIWWAIIIAEVCALCVSLSMLFVKRKKYHYF